MSYPADYGDTPPPFIYAEIDSDDEDNCGEVGYNDSDDEADCGWVGYNGDGVNKKIPAKNMLPSISWEAWHPNSSTGNTLSLLIQF
jgi:hypothetical protein